MEGSTNTRDITCIQNTVSLDLIHTLIITILVCNHLHKSDGFQVKVNAKYSQKKVHLGPNNLVSYLTPVSDLDLAPATDQFVAFPPVRY